MMEEEAPDDLHDPFCRYGLHDLYPNHSRGLSSGLDLRFEKRKIDIVNKNGNPLEETKNTNIGFHHHHIGFCLVEQVPLLRARVVPGLYEQLRIFLSLV